jgi:hypothetical protein
MQRIAMAGKRVFDSFTNELGPMVFRRLRGGDGWLAWHYIKYQKEQTLEDRATYAQAEEYAIKQKNWIVD